MAQAVLDLFPGRHLRHRPAGRERLLLRLRAAAGPRRQARHVRPEDLERIEARMREILAEAQPFVRDELTERARPRGLRRPPLQARDHRRRGRRPHLGHGVGPGPHLREPAGRRRGPSPPFAGYPGFIDLCRGPHVPDTKSVPRPLQADAGRRRLLAGRREATRCSSASTARRGRPRQDLDAHLAPARGGGQARPPQAGHRARPAQLPRGARRRPRRVAPQGRHRPQAHGGLLAASATPRAATSSSTRPTSPTGSCSRPRATSASTRTACTRPWRWTTASTTRSP